MILVFFLLFLLVGPVAYADAIGIPTGSAAPDFTLNTLDGKSVSLGTYNGKTVLLIYWRPDHDRSVLALQDEKDIFKRYKGKGVQVISLISGDENKDEVQKIVKGNEIDFPVLIDADRQVYSSYGIRVYPTTIIIKDGKIAYDISGHALDYKIMLEGNLQFILGEINEAKLKDMLFPQREEQDKSLLDAERRYNLALKFTEDRLFDQAIATAKKSIEAKPDIAKSHILLGFLLLETKEADKALDEFNKALEINPASDDAKTGLGSALILKGDVDKAIEVLTAASVANPHPQMTYFELGKAYELKGEKDKAIEMYRKAMEKIIKKKILPSSISKCE